MDGQTVKKTTDEVVRLAVVMKRQEYTQCYQSFSIAPRGNNQRDGIEQPKHETFDGRTFAETGLDIVVDEDTVHDINGREQKFTKHNVEFDIRHKNPS